MLKVQTCKHASHYFFLYGYNVVCTKEDGVVLLTSTAKPPFALCRDNI